MKRSALLLAALALVACETESANPSEGQAAALDSNDREGHDRKRGSAEICEAVSCTDDQQAQVEAIFARPEGQERAERPDMGAANAPLSKAFAGEDFSAADLQDWSAQAPAAPDRRSHHLESMSELHAILTAEQRATLATKISAGEVFEGRNDRGDKDGRSEDGEHDNRRVEHFCEPLQCSDEQQAQLAEVFARKPDARPDPQAKRDALAAAFRSDTFDADASRGADDRDPAAKGESLVQVHAILTAEQRAIVAERIAEHGPQALTGKGKGKGKRGGGKGERGEGKGKRGGGKGKRGGGKGLDGSVTH